MIPQPLPSLNQTVFRDIPIEESPRLLCPPGMVSAQSPKGQIIPDKEAGKAETRAIEKPPLTVLQEAHQAGYVDGLKSGLAEGRETGKHEGFDKGVIEGRELGIREGLKLTQEARASMTDRIERLDLLLKSLPGQLNSGIAARLEAAEEDMIALCYTVVCRLLGDKTLRRDRVVNGVRQAIEQCCKTGSYASLSGLIGIHVHPKDLELLESDAEFSLWLAQHRNGPIPWMTDDQIGLGGCIVRTTQGSLDARLETQFRALRNQILETYQPEALSPVPGPFDEGGE